MLELTQLPSWQALKKEYERIAPLQMRDWFAKDPQRFDRFSLLQSNILLDYSKNRITDQTLSALVQLAHESHLKQKIAALFSGECINSTEKKPALHTALRSARTATLQVNQIDIVSLVHQELEKMHRFVEQVHAQQWLGATGKPITDVVTIGVGGSHLGPLMTTHALKHHNVSGLRFHFISNLDGMNIKERLDGLMLEQTLFIISSKSFTTFETMANAQTIRQHMSSQGFGDVSNHFIAITAQTELAVQFGIDKTHVFTIWDWVGGRYSIWSAIGLPLALMIGMPAFYDFLRGAQEMDLHFQQADFQHNMPVILGLLGIWYINFFGATQHAISPYAHSLHYFRKYIQQMDMESNGKRITHHASEVQYHTAPIVWGEQGCDGQHSYHQLLHQSRHLIPVDFILVAKAHYFNHHQDILIASGLSQSKALMEGKSFIQALEEAKQAGYQELEATHIAKHKCTPGNRPSNTLLLQDMSPYTLGALIALYEHKVFVQGAIWNVNSFDQWGIELGKQLLPSILQGMDESTDVAQDCSTRGLIQYYQQFK